jgi:hypothetical protein
LRSKNYSHPALVEDCHIRVKQSFYKLDTYSALGYSPLKILLVAEGLLQGKLLQSFSSRA